MPVLIALGAQVVLHRDGRERTLPMEDLYLGYRKTAMAPGEFVRAVRVPLPNGRLVATGKVSKRVEQDISPECGGFALRIVGGKVTEARVAYGGMAATPKRAAQAETALIGQMWNQATIDAAKAALARDFTPLDDFRASAAYRLHVAGAMLQRVLLENP
jgi:xanthine dehydrogenase small subunit